MNITTALLLIIIVEITYLLYLAKPQKRSVKRTVFVDTSALMDARIMTAARTGFIPQHLTVPKSVITELQLLADQADSEKRLRARRGLDVISELQQVKGLKVVVLDDGEVGNGGVDARLMELALKKGGSICTIDFNLNKAATAQGITVLNINELAGSIRMAFLPGETISLLLTQKGQNSSQAIGYLSDGTMVVVDKASQYIGTTIEIEFVRSLQTSAGRMMFAKLAEGIAHSDSKPGRPADRISRGRKPVASRKVESNTQISSKRERKTSESREDALMSLLNEREQ